MAPHGTTINDTDRIVTDLNLTGDDATIFAMQCAKRLGVTVPPMEWRHVSTVGEAVALLTAYAESSGSHFHT